jgi:hypothetical protein
LERKTLIEKKLDAILEWAEDHEDFDSSFVESLQNQWEKRGFLSTKQIFAIDNIIERFNIEVL